MRIRPAGAGDYASVRRLLEEAGLPLAGVPETLDGYVVAEEEEGRIDGVAGLEVHGRDGVLRSVAVRPSSRSRGLGGRLTDRLLADARERGLRTVYLLTTTAAEYFPRYGFRVIDRQEASVEVRASVEFAEACPASAVAMALELE